MFLQIILVDDASDRKYLGKELEDAIENLEKVEILRSTNRTGLVGARLMGARSAVGDVLVFLDAHCEVSKASIFHRIFMFRLTCNEGCRIYLIIVMSLNLIYLITTCYLKIKEINSGITVTTDECSSKISGNSGFFPEI